MCIIVIHGRLFFWGGEGSGPSWDLSTWNDRSCSCILALFLSRGGGRIGQGGSAGVAIANGSPNSGWNGGFGVSANIET